MGHAGVLRYPGGRSGAGTGVVAAKPVRKPADDPTAAAVPSPKPKRAPKRAVRRPRVAEIVADELRDQILSSDLPDGASLPKQDQLIEDFGVSPPSLREALRILETEGLVSIVRGNVGGATVAVPRPEKVAYMLAMVLQSRGVAIDDVAASLGELESLCAAMAASLPDRGELVATLRARIDESRAVVDTDDYVRVARQFHEDLVAGCGNHTLIIVLGAVETLWSAHVEELTRRADEVAAFADPALRARSLKAHVAIADAIERGDATKASRLVRGHMTDPTQHGFMGTGLVVRSSVVRHASADGGNRPVP
jgi:GntR family transcriptional regulator, transcriptional repressor for pyruvate dehydrogenase complex